MELAVAAWKIVVAFGILECSDQGRSAVVTRYAMVGELVNVVRLGEPKHVKADVGPDAIAYCIKAGMDLWALQRRHAASSDISVAHGLKFLGRDPHGGW